MISESVNVWKAWQSAVRLAGCSVGALHPYTNLGAVIVRCQAVAQTQVGMCQQTPLCPKISKRAKSSSLLMRRRGWCISHGDLHRCDGMQLPPHGSAWYATLTGRTSSRFAPKAAPRPGVVVRTAARVRHESKAKGTSS